MLFYQFSLSSPYSAAQTFEHTVYMCRIIECWFLLKIIIINDAMILWFYVIKGSSLLTGTQFIYWNTSTFEMVPHRAVSELSASVSWYETHPMSQWERHSCSEHLLDWQALLPTEVLDISQDSTKEPIPCARVGLSSSKWIHTTGHRGPCSITKWRS